MAWAYELLGRALAMAPEPSATLRRKDLLFVGMFVVLCKDEVNEKLL
jgi:hypothetical protein